MHARDEKVLKSLLTPFFPQLVPLIYCLSYCAAIKAVESLAWRHHLFASLFHKQRLKSNNIFNSSFSLFFLYGNVHLELIFIRSWRGADEWKRSEICCGSWLRRKWTKEKGSNFHSRWFERDRVGAMWVDGFADLLVIGERDVLAISERDRFVDWWVL